MSIADTDKYRREPQHQWQTAVEEAQGIEDRRERAVALLRYALGAGALFLSTADRENQGSLPFETDKQWADFFESAEAEMARRGVHGAANAAFCALTLEQKLQALAVFDTSSTDDDTDVLRPGVIDVGYLSLPLETQEQVARDLERGEDG